MNLLKKLMTVCIPVALLMNSVSEISAQSYKTERRIYLWDVSISMVGATGQEQFVGCEPPRDRKNPSYKYNEDYPWYNQEGDIFVRTRQVLIESIRSIKDEKCEIVVIPYVAAMQTPMVAATATDENKERLIAQINAWDKLKQGGNKGGTCLECVMREYEDDKFNRVILLTDGQDYAEDKLVKIISEWEVDSYSKYRDDRLVYAILSPKAFTENASIVELIDKKNSDGKDHGVVYLADLQNLQEFVSFSLGGYEHEMLVESDFVVEVDFPIECRLNMGCEDDIKCNFVSDCKYVSVNTSSAIKSEGGKFIVPLRFNFSSREELLDIIGRGNKSLSVTMTCSVDESCKNVALEGRDKIQFDLCIEPQPKAIVSISAK